MKTKYLVFVLGFFAAAVIGLTTVKLISPTIADLSFEIDDFDERLVDEHEC